VQGTLWLDRATSQLQFLEYSYTPVPEHLKGEGIGGRVDYAQLPTGGWFVSNWHIRMPILRSLPTLPGPANSTPMPGRIVVSALQIAGGTVHEIRLDNEVLYLNSGAALAGSRPGDEVFPTDRGMVSESGLLRNAEFATAVCGTQLTFEHEGFITGRVLDETLQPFSGALVTAQWKEQFSIILGTSFRWQNYQVSAITSSEGTYQLCGVAVRRTVSVFATRGMNEKLRRPSFVRLTEDSPVAQLDLTLAPPPQKDKDAPEGARHW